MASTGGPTTQSSRRDLIKKGAIVGGVVWAAPVVQTLTAGPAGAAGSVPPSCVLSIIPAPGALCTAPSGTPYRGRAAAGGGQFRATHNGGGMFTASWPVTPDCSGSGCSVSAEWTWAQDTTTSTTDCANGTSTTGINNAVVTGPLNGSTVQFQKSNLVANFGITLSVSVTFTCGNQTSTQSRIERLRQVGDQNAALADTFLP